MSHSFATGFGLGFVVAAQVGPIWVFCARSVLRGIGTGRDRDRRRRGRDRCALRRPRARRRERDPRDRPRPHRLRRSSARDSSPSSALRTLWSAFRIRLGGETDGRGVVAAPRIRHLARRHRLEPGDDRLLGRGLRGRGDGQSRRYRLDCRRSRGRRRDRDDDVVHDPLDQPVADAASRRDRGC